MKDRRFGLALSGIAASFVALATSLASFTLSWFTNKDVISSPMHGQTYGSYFAYGNGSEESPYGITRPFHLYNLAWLQYLGRFNQIENGSLKQQYHFELGADIDASGFSLPPIGTREYPFVGEFQGNGHSISGLKISNTYSTLTTPSAVTSLSDGEDTYLHILGLFGVVGNYLPDESSSTSPYSTIVPEISNFSLLNASVVDSNAASGESNQVLMGLAAGYVNGKLSNIAVSQKEGEASSLVAEKEAYAFTSGSSDFQAISKYSLVGYCTPKYESSIHQLSSSVTTPGVSQKNFTVNDQGDKTGWGGGIDMRSINTRLQKIRDEYCASPTSDNPYYYYRSYSVKPDGERTAEDTVSWKEAPVYGPGSNKNSPVFYNSGRYGSSSYNEKIGNYHFIRSNDGKDEENGDGTDIYTMLSGGHYEKDRYLKASGTETRNYYAIYRTSSNTTYYLALDDSGAVINDCKMETAVWSLPEKGELAPIYGIFNGTKRYLINVDGELGSTTDASKADLWFRYSYTGTSESLVNIHDGELSSPFFQAPSGTGTGTGTTVSPGWHLEAGSYSSTATEFFLEKDGYYLGCQQNGNSYSPALTTNIQGATYWVFKASGSGYILSTSIVIGNTKSAFYLAQSGAGFSLVTSEASASVFTASSFPSKTLSLKAGLRYLHWDKGIWSTSSSKADLCLVAASSLWRVISFNASGPSYEYGVSYEEEKTIKDSSYWDDDATYAPISATLSADEEEGKSLYEPTDHNTGYIVGGSSYSESSTDINSYNYYHWSYSNVRFGSFSLDLLKNYYDNDNGFTKVLTIDSSLREAQITSRSTSSGKSIWTTANDSTPLTKYEEVKNSLYKNALKGHTNVWGVHFLPASISMDHLVNASYVSINNEEYHSYQMPANSIDFRLKEKGSINFMAGTYFNDGTTNNDSFFALHQIVRSKENSGKIEEIREIDGIYQNPTRTDASYVYRYEDGTYSKPYVLSAKGEKLDLDGNALTDEDGTLSTLPTGYELTFDTARIKKQQNLSLNAAFYFEVPVNEGEFALGSDPDGVGSYLMYLDIGASAKETNRSQFTELIVESDRSLSYPSGIALVSPAVLPSDINASDSACASIVSGYSGTLTLSRSGNTVTLGGSASLSPPSYAGAGISLVSSDGAALPEVSSSSTDIKKIRRMLYYDYSVNTKTLTKVEFIETQYLQKNNLTGATTELSSSKEIHRYYQEDGAWKEDASELSSNSIVLVYRDHAEGDKKSGTSYDADELKALTWEDPSTSSVAVEFSYSFSTSEDGSGLQIDYVLNVISDEDGYQSYSGYAIAVSGSSPDIKVGVTKEPTGGETITITLNGTVIYSSKA